MDNAKLKQNFSMRLAPDLREDLEKIAGRELRTLANQITFFIVEGIKEYALTHDDIELKNAPNTIKTFGDGVKAILKKLPPSSR